MHNKIEPSLYLQISCFEIEIESETLKIVSAQKHSVKIVIHLPSL